MPIVIVEGIDGSGKSTFTDLIESFVPNNFNIIRAHKGVMAGTVEDEYIHPLRNLDENDFFIADRWHVGEMIYGPIYRGKSEVSGMYELMIEVLLDISHAEKIILNPNIDLIYERLAERGEDYLRLPDVPRVHEFYNDYARKHKYKTFTEPGVKEAKQIVRRLLKGK
jgi:thymidylate kinase